MNLSVSAVYSIRPSIYFRTAYEFVLARLSAMMVTRPAGDSFQSVVSCLIFLLPVTATYYSYTVISNATATAELSALSVELFAFSV